MALMKQPQNTVMMKQQNSLGRFLLTGMAHLMLPLISWIKTW